MKQLAFMIVATLCGTAGIFLWGPYSGILVYYLFAVLRPQYLWIWTLPKDVNWSYYVAFATTGAALLALVGILDVRGRPSDGRPNSQRVTWAHAAVLLFAFWIAVTYFTARNREAAEFCFMEYVKIFVMYVVAAYIIRTQRQVWLLFIMATLSLVYIAYEINQLYFFSHAIRVATQGYGGLDNNGAGLMLAMGMPLCWFAYEGTARWWRWGFVCLIPLIIHAVLMTYSRGAMLSMIVTTPLIVFRSRQRAMLGIALVCFGLFALPVLAGPEIKARFLTIENNETDDSANSRRAAWKAAWQMAKENPIFGMGVRNSPLFSHQYGADIEGRVIHSQYLQIAADNGFVGLGLYLFMFGTAWFSLRRCRKFAAKQEMAASRTIVSCVSGIECSLVLFMFGSLFLSLEVFELPYLLLLLSAQFPIVIGAFDETHSLAAERGDDHAAQFDASALSATH